MKISDRSIQINYLIAYLFIITSGYYITRLPLSPIYFFMLASLFLFSNVILSKGELLINQKLFIPVMYIFYLIVFQIINQGQLSASINQIMSVSYFFVSFLMLKSIPDKKIIRIAKRTVQFSLLLLTVEAVYRLMNPIWKPNSFIDYHNYPTMFFYPYKINSIMYQDSNYVAVFILVLFFLTLYLKRYYSEPLRFERILLFLLALATISRSVTIVIVLFWSFEYARRIKGKMMKVLIAAMVFLAVLIFLYFFSLKDQSTLIKFNSFIRTFDVLHDMSFFNIIFGNGIGNSAVLLGGISAHNIIEALLVETGIMGIILFTLIHIHISKLSRGKANYIIFPFLLAGMSLFVNAAPYYYAILGIIVTLEQRKLLGVKCEQ